MGAVVIALSLINVAHTLENTEVKDVDLAAWTQSNCPSGFKLLPKDGDTKSFCRYNNWRCEKFDQNTGNCTSCNTGWSIDKSATRGDHCTMTWWMWLLVILGILIAIGLIASGCFLLPGAGKSKK